MQRMTRCAPWAATSLALAACAALAADPATAPATRPAGTQPAAAATRAATTSPVKVTLNFKDAPLDTVLDYLSQNAGFIIVRDGATEGRVTILSKQPVSPEEAITLVNAALKVNGFTAMRDGRILRIAARDKAKKGNIPVNFGSKPEDIANTEELITQVIPIENVSATKLRDDLKPLMGPDADVAANDGSNTIIITDASSSIRRIVQIIANLDKHEAATSEIRIIPLKFANATAAVKLIETFFKNQGGGAQMTPQQMMQMQQQGMPVPPQRGGSEKHGASVVLAADDRTNTLVMMGSPGQLTLIENILKKLDSNPIPASEMKSFPLKFAQAEATAKLINNLFKPPKSDNSDLPYFMRRFGGGEEQSSKDIKVNAVFDERTNTLIVTAPAAALAGVEEMVKMLDASPMASSDLKVFQLKYADAFIVSKLIEDMFKAKDDSGSRFPFFIFSDGPAPSQSKGVKVNVTSDDRTNSLIVSAPTELLKVIEGIITKLDANPASEDTLFIYHLRNGQAGNLEYVLNVLFGNINSQGQNNGQNGQGQPGNPDDPQQRQNRANRTTSSNNNVGTPDNGSRSNTRRNNRVNQAGTPRLSPGMASAVNALTGKVFVVADQDTNALLVTTASKYEKQVRAIIDDLDRPVPQVLIKVLVAEVTHDNSADLGVDFSVLNTRPSGNGQIAGTNFGNTALKGGLVVSVIETNITATLHALAEENKLDVLSRPYLLASDNQLANILIGQSVPFVTNTRITESGQQINDIQYRDIGLSLNVTPHINPDGVVILDVTPEISQLTSQTVPISSTTNAPVIAKRSAESRIGVMDGQTIVIGGLMEDRKISNVQKVPLLGDIPVLSWFFNRTQVKKTKTELLIFLTPHVAQRPEELQPMAEDESRNTKLTPGAVAPGTYDDHMDALRRPQPSRSQSGQPISPVNSIDLSPPDKPLPPPPTIPTPSTEPPQR
ncbi:MAG: gspD 1 [Phycisphaerales bacterium]|nr:gspD 1 [Phycisphaerales bacterium]